VFFCVSLIHLIFRYIKDVACFTFYQSSIFFLLRGMLEKRWWSNIICNETIISVILAIIYSEIKSNIKMQQRTLYLNTENLLSSNPNYCCCETVDNIEKMWDSNQLEVYYNGMVALATKLVMCIWIHMIFKVQKYVAFVLVSKILCVIVVHNRYHEILVTIF